MVWSLHLKVECVHIPSQGYPLNRSVFTACVSLGCSILPLSLCAAQGLNCPPMPDKVTQVNRDVRTEVSAGVGSLGKLKAGEVGVRTDVVAKNLFEKYPNADRIMVVQMMAATYCSLLNSKSINDSEKLRRWEQFSERVFKFENPNYSPAPHSSLQKRTAHEPHLTFKDAPEFTPFRKQIIVQDVSEMNDFFASLGISTPDTLPPFTAKEGFGTFTPPLEYRGELIIPRSAVKDRRVVTRIYADYVIQKAVPWKAGGFYDVFRR